MVVNYSELKISVLEIDSWITLSLEGKEKGNEGKMNVGNIIIDSNEIVYLEMVMMNISRHHKLLFMDLNWIMVFNLISHIDWRYNVPEINKGVGKRVQETGKVSRIDKGKSIEDYSEIKGTGKNEKENPRVRVEVPKTRKEIRIANQIEIEIRAINWIVQKEIRENGEKGKTFIAEIFQDRHEGVKGRLKEIGTKNRKDGKPIRVEKVEGNGVFCL